MNNISNDLGLMKAFTVFTVFEYRLIVAQKPTRHC